MKLGVHVILWTRAEIRWVVPAVVIFAAGGFRCRRTVHNVATFIGVGMLKRIMLIQLGADRARKDLLLDGFLRLQ